MQDIYKNIVVENKYPQSFIDQFNDNLWEQILIHTYLVTNKLMNWLQRPLKENKHMLKYQIFIPQNSVN